MGRKKKESKENKMDEDIENYILSMEKQFGKGTIMKMAEGYIVNVPAIPTDIYELDKALGVGGFPKGRIIEVYGAESSGKTSLLLYLTAQVQRNSGNVLYVDVEHAIDIEYGKKAGVNWQEVFLSQPDSGEQALTIVERAVDTGKFDLIVVDSVASLVPEAELMGEMGDSQIALQARLMSKAMRKLAGKVDKTKTCLVFINQIREKINVMFGSPETTSGGRALKFYASIRLRLAKTANLLDGKIKVGAKIKAVVKKNKVAPPFKEAEFKIMYDEGVSKTCSIIDQAIENKVIKKAGAWFSYKGENIAQGYDALRKLMINEPNRLEEIKKDLFNKKEKSNETQSME